MLPDAGKIMTMALILLFMIKPDLALYSTICDIIHTCMLHDSCMLVVYHSVPCTDPLSLTTVLDRF